MRSVLAHDGKFGVASPLKSGSIPAEYPGVGTNGRRDALTDREGAR